MKIVIFAGGVGTRLWPLSRKNSPKQFGKIIGDKSTLQEAVQRLLPKFKYSDIYIATGRQYEEIVKEQLRSIPEENFILEPLVRDVGPAIGLAASILEKRFPDEPIGILWSDHLVKKTQEFLDALSAAEKMVLDKKSNFVFIAQKPRFANQNMGWIEIGDVIERFGKDMTIYSFKNLRYRPSLDEAKTFFNKKNFVWNLGYFVTTPKYLFSLFKQHVPEIYYKLCQIQKAVGSDNFSKVLDKIYP